MSENEYGLPLTREQFTRLFDELRLMTTKVEGPGARWWLQGGIVVTLVTGTDPPCFYASIEASRSGGGSE